MYELEDEKPLVHRLLAAMDGNNSLKLVDDSFRWGTQRIDTRTGRADRWLSANYVDQFKDEVPSRGKRGGMGAPGDQHGGNGEVGDDDDDDDDAWLDVEGGDNEDGRFKKAPVDVDNPVPDVPPNPCTDRWKNAGPDGQKKMFSMFSITGIFLCLCRHGMLLLLCDMIQSGEL
jgi:Kyakuja-Dileera-Zisupton transposase